MDRPSVAAIVATCRLFRVDRRSAFAASFRRLNPKYPFIPNGLRFDLSTAFRRGSVRFVAPTARPPIGRFSSRAVSLENVEKRWKTRASPLVTRAAEETWRRVDEKADGWTSTRRPAKPWFRKSLRDAELREAAAAKERAKTGLFDATSSALAKRRREDDGEIWRRKGASFCRVALSSVFFDRRQIGRAVEKRVGNFYTAPFIALRLVRAFGLWRSNDFVETNVESAKRLKSKRL